MDTLSVELKFLQERDIFQRSGLWLQMRADMVSGQSVVRWISWKRLVLTQMFHIIHFIMAIILLRGSRARERRRLKIRKRISIMNIMCLDLNGFPTSLYGMWMERRYIQNPIGSQEMMMMTS